MMFKVGEMVQGYTYNQKGEEVLVVGAYQCTTDDPEEYIQDVIVRTHDGRTVYLDEQGVRSVAKEMAYFDQCCLLAS
jgi:hypothetical protein